MALVARRKLDETWRICVERRAAEFGFEGPATAYYEASRGAGLGEAEAAYRALGEYGCLWEVEAPDDPGADLTPEPRREEALALAQI